MELSRRRLLQAGLLGMAGAAVGATAACGKEKKAPGGQSKNLALWYWPDGLSDKVVADVPKQFSDITFNATKIGGDFKQKLVTTITSRQFLPDITGIKGEDIAYFMTQAGQFLDLRDLGAGDLKSQYLEWKWKQGSTPDGKQIGFPIDIGPTALFYRRDVYEKAGLDLLGRRTQGVQEPSSSGRSASDATESRSSWSSSARCGPGTPGKRTRTGRSLVTSGSVWSAGSCAVRRWTSCPSSGTSCEAT